MENQNQKLSNFASAFYSNIKHFKNPSQKGNFKEFSDAVLLLHCFNSQLGLECNGLLEDDPINTGKILILINLQNI